MRRRFGLWWVLCLWLSGHGLVRADAGTTSYALIVGANEGGAGQRRLAFAERDAEHMAKLLEELGRTPSAHIRLLRQPSARDVGHALRALRTELSQNAARGVSSQVVFYYSGHARAGALSLGDEELVLSTLRADLVALPSTLTVVVLDACQSGAFSGVKGAARAEDFSLSSVENLHSQGVAVMASSTATEFSQESRELGSSYFTHHLMVALRGAGDDNQDGRVSLTEAYRYAYDRTLSDTARTKVGSQHATLETELTGRGEVPLSYPMDADARLELPASAAGRVLIQKQDRGVVLAELAKVSGAPLLLALPSGRYEVLVRSERDSLRAHSCQLTLARGTTHTLDLRRCTQVVLDDHRDKGARPPAYELWFFELGLGQVFTRTDDYTSTLETFRFRDEGYNRGFPHAHGTIGVALHPAVSLTVRFDELGSGSYHRDLQGPDEQTRDESFDWQTYSVMLGARGRLPLAQEWLVAFLDLSAGAGVARSKLSGKGVHRVEHDYGPVLRAGVGLSVGIFRYLGMYVATGYVFAPVLSNDIGQTRDDGGIEFGTGLHLRGLDRWF